MPMPHYEMRRATFSTEKPSAAFDVAGAGNLARPRRCDTRKRKSESMGEHKLRPKPARHSPTLPTSGRWCNSIGRLTQGLCSVEHSGKIIQCTCDTKTPLLKLARLRKKNLWGRQVGSIRSTGSMSNVRRLPKLTTSSRTSIGTPSWGWASPKRARGGYCRAGGRSDHEAQQAGLPRLRQW
jgi:hypothetical protein